ncbi:MAG: Xaa-Pro peptidase family protein [Pseudomonadota bacterium]
MTQVVGRECVFEPEELQGRQAQARAALDAAGHDLLIVTSPENIFWLTGQQTPGYYTFQALFFPSQAEPFFLIRQLEALNCQANSYIEDVTTYQDDETPAQATVALARERGFGDSRIAIEKRGWFLTVALYEELRGAFAKIGNGSDIIERLRQIKSPSEIANLERAATYVDAGMRAAIDRLQVGATENDLVAAMFQASVAAGSEYFGMEPLVSVGPRSGVPHGTWRRRPLAAGDPAFLELAAVHNRYHAALMRSAWIGKPPDRARRMYDTCLEALEAAIEALKPGARCSEVHAACQAVIDRNGFTDGFRKRTGYSTGISFAPDWGEGNVLSLFRGVDQVLEPGMAFHMPPALRDYGVFTVGVSETAIVTESGCRTLGAVPRDMIVVA